MFALGRKLSLSLLAACLLPCDEDARAAEYGLDAAEAIGPFLNGVFPSQAPGPSGGWKVTRVFPNIAANLPTFCGVYPGTNKMLIVEKAGRILKFENDQASSTTEVFLDIPERVYSNSDSGMTYFAFHPEFGQAGSPNRGYVYVTYKFSPNGDTGDLAYWRLSRFTVQDGQTVADPASEQILIQQFDRQQWHDSGCMVFGTDGFLYVGIGDEGGAGDQYNDTQKINDRLFSGVLRIDVNQDATKSHAIRRQPLPQAAMPAGWPASFTANYYIPNDNPWVNEDASVLEEFYALGFRNPYRFNTDPETGRIWVGDVGQDYREEVDLLVRGGNYGWAFREGNSAGPKTRPTSIVGTLEEPKFTYGRDLGGCVVAGYFYHGTEHPSLVGKQLIVDNTSGRIWALTKGENDTVTAQYLCSMPSGSVYTGTVTCVQEHGGEIYFLKLGNSYRGEFYKLARTGAEIPEPPALLSQTGAFTSLASLSPRAGLIPYEVNSPLWSDAALKRRWIAVPNDGSHDTAGEKIAFLPDAEWSFPAGTVFVKHFELNTDENTPSAVRKLETRFLVISESGEPYGVTYQWRPDGSDADLLKEGATDTVAVALSGGGSRNQTWAYPSRNDCMICHNSNAKYVLGVKTWQLNGNMIYPKTGRTANQLATLGHLGMFDEGYREEHIPYFLKAKNIADVSAPLETRVRSYIDANCAQCHRPGGVRAHFDARFTTPIADQGLVRGKVESAFTGESESVIQPGDAPHSVMYLRAALVGTKQMPPLAKNLADAQALQQIQSWVDSLRQGAGVTLTSKGFTAQGDLLVDVAFSNSVAGLSAADFRVHHGRAAELTGSGNAYVLRIVPSAGSVASVLVDLPAGSAVSGELGNHASNRLVLDRPASGLVTWLKLDETAGLVAADISGAENNGTMTNFNADDWSEGKFGGALRFEKTGAKITLGNKIVGDYTLSFWMKTTEEFPVTSSTLAQVPLFVIEAPGSANDLKVVGFRLPVTISSIGVMMSRSDGGTGLMSSTSKIVTGEWVHIVVRRTHSTGIVELFVNGRLDKTGLGSTQPFNVSPTLVVGQSGMSTYDYHGFLDQIRIYNRAISEAERLALDASGPSTGGVIGGWYASALPGLTHLQDLDLDPDGDGLTNLGEFALAGDPLAPTVSPLRISDSGMGAELRFLNRKGQPGLTYSIEMSPTQASWKAAGSRIQNVGNAAGPSADFQWTSGEFVPAATESSMFFRLKVSGDPQ